MVAEKEMRLSVAAQSLPGRPSAEALLRWIRSGVLSPEGTRVHMAGRKIGGCWHVTARAMEEFSQAVTPARQEPMRRRNRYHARRHRRRHQRAMAELAAQGLLPGENTDYTEKERTPL